MRTPAQPAGLGLRRPPAISNQGERGHRLARACSAATTLAGVGLRTAVGFALVIGLAVTVPRLFGYRALTVLSGSMTPTLRVGDVVIDRPISAADARVGDVVSFRSPENRGRVVTHRIVHLRTDGRQISVVTRGDANTGVERWTIPADGTLGRVAYRIPKLGYAANRLGSRFGRLGFLVIPALLLGLYELRRIWTPRHDDDVPA